MTTPTITVFLPCYNAHVFLPRALESLRAQTFQDFETLIINDGSTNLETLAYLETVPDDVQVIHQENRGLAGARNRGFGEAAADLILPLDCDDWLAPEFLADAYAKLQSTPEKCFVFADLALEGEAGGILKKPFNLFEQLFFNQLPYCMLIPKSAWQAIGGYDETMRLGYEDWEFNIRLGLNGYTGIPLGEPHFHYHVSASGMLASTSRARHIELWRYIRDKNQAAYKPAQLWTRWRRWRQKESVRPLLLYLFWEVVFHLLPDSMLGMLFRLTRPMSHSAREARRLERDARPESQRGWRGVRTALLKQASIPAAIAPALLSRIAAYLTLIVAARVMIPDEFGVFAVLSVVGGIINAMVSGGGDMWLNRFVTRRNVTQGQPPQLWLTYFAISVVVAALAMMIAGLATATIPALAEQSDAVLIAVFAFSIAGIGEALLAMIRASGRTTIFFGVRDVAAPLGFLALLLLIRPADAVGLFAVFAAVWGIILVSLGTYVFARMHWMVERIWMRASMMVPVLKHTVLLMLTNLASRAANYVDILILLFFIGLTDLGEYRVAAQFAIGFIVVQHFVFLNLPYQLRDIGADTERSLIRQKLRDSQSVLIILAIVALLIALLAAEPLLLLLGARFADAVGIVQVLFLIRFLELLWGPQHEVLVSNGLIKFDVGASLVGIGVWAATFTLIQIWIEPIQAAILATAIGVHTAHALRAVALTRADIFCPRILPALWPRKNRADTI